jgi:hypothetical protein
MSTNAVIMSARSLPIDASLREEWRFWRRENIFVAAGQRNLGHSEIWPQRIARIGHPSRRYAEIG